MQIYDLDINSLRYQRTAGDAWQPIPIEDYGFYLVESGKVTGFDDHSVYVEAERFDYRTLELRRGRMHTWTWREFIAENMEEIDTFLAIVIEDDLMLKTN